MRPNEKRILIDGVYKDEPRVVCLGVNNTIEAFEYSIKDQKQIKGNIYLAVVKRIEPALQAAFIEYGDNQKGFLPLSEIAPCYFNILSNKKHILPIQSIKDKDLSNLVLEDQETILDDDDDELDIENITKNIDLDDISQTEQEDCEINEDTQKDETQINIQDSIRKGQVLLVQAQKDARGNKGASFSTFISIAGRYCVLMPTKAQGHGISKKIASSSERSRLRKLIEQLTAHSSENVSIIMRTSCKAIASEQIKSDYQYIVKLWNKIQKLAAQVPAPSFIHMEEGIIQKTIRDILSDKVQEVLVQGLHTYTQTVKCVNNIIPSASDKVKLYDDNVPIFTKFGIENKIASLYQPVVEMPSGGYIVINPAEGLTLIDVNSGRSNTQKSVEDTALNTNLEAAVTIAQQIKIRDISGLIVVDFIDMKSGSHRKIVKKVLDKALTQDSARTSTGNISQFGILEMSRQRVRSSFLEVTTIMCPTCKGKGVVRSENVTDMLILRTLENEISTHPTKLSGAAVFTHLDIALSLLNNRKAELVRIEKKYGIEIAIINDPEAHLEEFAIEKISKEKEGTSSRSHVLPLLVPDLREVKDNVADEENEEVLSNRKSSKNHGRRVTLSQRKTTNK
ncbi:Rne/Rng family ribonuclease [Candidatus Sneabacter namystus]|uniref:Ribonuclease G n=1 Tax=Candidatus Sneabacter namystus TaxID=2601646 RepID=A0A5C0UJE2_9RICK|nr:Rne/Rng family ribonuclease [Candidatus Sneabacter namystus]QEK39721.1 Rne/Rng family ribonuclease [Candidatus Sneabacter namystus]